MQRAGEAFDAIVAFIGRTARLVRKLALLAFGAAVLIWLAIATQIRAAREPTTLTLWAIFLAASPAILLAFSIGLRRLQRVRDHVRSVPDRVVERSDELRHLAREARSAQRGRGRSLLAAVRFWRTVAGTRELVTTLLPARLVFVPGVLMAVLIALLGALLEIVVAPFAALWLLLAAAL
jgi:hypothetical protein